MRDYILLGIFPFLFGTFDEKRRCRFVGFCGSTCSQRGPENCEFCHITTDNLALKKQTWQSNTLLGHSSDKAVDGQFDDRSIEGNQCAISGGEHDYVTWRVDLGSIQHIQSITIIYRTDGILWRRSNFPTYFLGFSIHVSNTTSKEDGILYFHDTQCTIDTIPSSFTLNKSVLGRYVTYYNTREGDLSNKEGYSTFAYLDLCEVQVHGCPFVGFYGKTCSQRCPVNCQICHIKTGECLGGCTTGFEGDRCEQFTRVCENNMYGPRCSLPCGNCLYRQGEQCHHVTGQCPRGCVEGYSGEGCTEASDFWRDWTSENLFSVPLYIVISLLVVSVVINVIFVVQLKKNKVTVQEIQINEA